MVLLLREHALALVAAFVLLLACAWAFVREAIDIPAPPEAHDVLPAPKPEDVAPAPSNAIGLRQRARRECDAQEWFACAQDLDAARAIDPAGETKETQDLRDLATVRLHPPVDDKPKPQPWK
jgi:hypothetical protein